MNPPPAAEQNVPEANEPAPLKAGETNGSSVPSLEVEKENKKKKRKSDITENTISSENNVTNGVDQCVAVDTKKKGKKRKSGVEDGMHNRAFWVVLRLRSLSSLGLSNYFGIKCEVYVNSVIVVT